MSPEDRLTAALQAAGPDEFPEGYYRHLARERLGVSNSAPEADSSDVPLCAGEPDWRRDSLDPPEPCFEEAEPGSDYCPAHNPDNL